MTILQQPPILRGNDTEKISRIHSYLYQISRDLNSALNNLTEDNFADGSAASQILRKGGTEAQKKEQSENLSSLKSLIIKTADNVRAEMDVLETTLESEYVAQSDLGEFNEQIQADIQATASGLTQSIQYNAEIFDQYRIDTQGYIRQGIIGFNDDAQPIIGVAIGQQIKTVEQSVDGETYEVIDTTDDMAVWTPNRLSFFVNGMEVAHFSNRALNTGDVVIGGKLALSNNKWEINHTNGFTIKWIGGDGA